MKAGNDHCRDRSIEKNIPKVDRLTDLLVKSIGSLCVAVLLAPVFVTPAQSGRDQSSCRFVSGFIHGQLIGATDDCGGALTEVGTFTDSDDNVLGTFVACATSFTTRDDGALMFGLAHTYTTLEGDTFTTTDRIVAPPIDPPLYGVNNQAVVTGGSGALSNAFGRIRDHGTVDLATGVVSVEYDGQICTPR